MLCFRRKIAAEHDFYGLRESWDKSDTVHLFLLFLISSVDFVCIDFPMNFGFLITCEDGDNCANPFACMELFFFFQFCLGYC